MFFYNRILLWYNLFGDFMKITFRNLENNNMEFRQLYEWCKNSFVYEWFEQRILSLEEITCKYKNKLKEGKQTIYIIQYDDIDIGLIQIYQFPNDINIKILKKYKNIYEYDLFIGKEEYLSKGIGSEIVRNANKLIYNYLNADAIILRPFKRNIRAIKCYKKCGFKLIGEYIGKNTINDIENISVFLNEKSTN